MQPTHPNQSYEFFPSTGLTVTDPLLHLYKLVVTLLRLYLLYVQPNIHIGYAINQLK